MKLLILLGFGGKALAIGILQPVHRSERNDILESFELDCDQGSMRPRAGICNV